MGKYDIEFVKMPLKDLVSPDYNPRRIDDKEFELLKKSIREYGYIRPILVNKKNNVIIAGNQRYKALVELNRENHGKFTRIDVVLVDWDVLKEKGFNVLDNKIGGEFDKFKLDMVYHELEDAGFDMELAGFYDEIEDVDLDAVVDDLDSDLDFDSEPVFMVSVKCDSARQQDLLFEQLKRQGYNVKSIRY